MSKLSNTFFLFVITAFLSLVTVHIAQAEGSVDVTASGGHRAILDYTDKIEAGLKRRTLIQVYAKAGEEIRLGSSANGIGNGKIVVIDPNGNKLTSTGTGGVGIIENLSQELAGPFPANGGYTPFVVPVSTTGVYVVEFHGPHKSNSGGGSKFNARQNWNLSNQTTTEGKVLAWDATVVKNGTPKTGRVFTNAFAANMGSNGQDFSALFYILTNEGWLYSVDANGMDPFGFIFVANSRGNRVIDGSVSAFRSVNQSNASVADPEAPDGSNVTHKIFFNKPNSDLPETAKRYDGTIWLSPEPVDDPEVEDFTFVGLEGTEGATGYLTGGDFEFETNISGRYLIRIDINGNGKTNDAIDLALTADMENGKNSVPWNGKDGLGNFVEPGTIEAKAITLEGLYGEVHFPLFDAENHPAGFILKRLNGPESPDYTVYWDDTEFSGSNFTQGLDNTDGMSSKNGAHRWVNNVGDKRVIDTWAYIEHPKLGIETPIEIRRANLAIESNKIVSGKVVVGEELDFEIVISNTGETDARGVEFYYKFAPEYDVEEDFECVDEDDDLVDCDFVELDNNTITLRLDVPTGSEVIVRLKATITEVPESGELVNMAGVVRPPDYSDDEATVPVKGGFEQDYDFLTSQCAVAGFYSPLCNNLLPFGLSNVEDAKEIELLLEEPEIPLVPPVEDPLFIVDPNEIFIPEDAPETFDDLLERIKEAQKLALLLSELSPVEESENESAFFTEYPEDILGCEPKIRNSITPSSSATDVFTLKTLLNGLAGESLALHGEYDLELRSAVKRYQEHNIHQITILAASGEPVPTGLVDLYTMAQLNVDDCFASQVNRCPYFFDYIALGDADGTQNQLQDSVTTQVNLWKEFLYLIFPDRKPVYNGVYDQAMREQVGRYHTLYSRTILKPWQTANPDAKVTYYLREASRNWANYMVKCPEGPIELFDGSPDVNYY